jgi:maleate isomerase
MTIESKKYHISDTLTRNSERPSVGLIVLNTDFTFERDFVRLYNEHQPEFDFYFNRIHFANPMTPHCLAAIEGDLTQVSNEILPGYDLDLVVFNCTSSSSILGDDAVKLAIQKSKPNAKVLTTSQAVVGNIMLKGINKISVLTPYNNDVSTLLADYLQRQGLEILSAMHMDMDDDRDVAMLPADEIIKAAKAAIHDDADAIFISCTAMRSAEIIPEIEAAIGKPVFTSNQATFDQISNMIENLHT